MLASHSLFLQRAVLARKIKPMGKWPPDASKASLVGASTNGLGSSPPGASNSRRDERGSTEPPGPRSHSLGKQDNRLPELTEARREGSQRGGRGRCNLVKPHTVPRYMGQDWPFHAVVNIQTPSHPRLSTTSVAHPPRYAVRPGGSVWALRAASISLFGEAIARSAVTFDLRAVPRQ